MEFHHLNVSAYFRLELKSLQAGIELTYVSFEGGSEDPDRNTARLIEAIEDARLPQAVRRSRGEMGEDAAAHG